MGAFGTRSVVLAGILVLAACGPTGCSQRQAPAAPSAEASSTAGPTSYAQPGTIDTSFVTRRFLDVPYDTGSAAQKLDIYLPDVGSAPYPVIVAIHGGGYRTGDKADGQIAPMLSALGRGYAVVSLGYRLSGEAKWPAQINDAKAAIRFLRANATTYSLDPNRIAAWGDSAGGDLAALLGTSGGARALSDLSQGNPKQSDRIQAVVDWFGPIDFARMDPQFTQSGLGRVFRNTPNSPESELFGAALPVVPNKVRAANATTYISPDDPPTLIEHGTKDDTVPVEQSEEFAMALTRVLGAGNVTLRLLPGAGHMDPAFATGENLTFVLDWLDVHMK